MVHQPQNLSVAIAEHQCATFFEDVDMPVGQIVADQFGAFHAIGHKAIAGFHGAQGQGKAYLCHIERGLRCVFLNLFAMNLLNAQLGRIMINIDASLRNAQGGEVGHDGLCQQAPLTVG